MSRVMKKLAARRGSRQRGEASSRKSKSSSTGSMMDDDSASSPLTSPVSVASNEIFKTKSRGSYGSTSGGLAMAPFGEEGDLRSLGHGSGSKMSIHFDGNRIMEQTSEAGDLNFSDSYFVGGGGGRSGSDAANSSTADFHSSINSSSSRKAKLETGRGSTEVFQRATSVQRPMQESSIELLDRTDDVLEKSRRRSKSTGRSTRRDQIAASAMRNYKSSSKEESFNNNDDNDSSPKKRKSKMEKILQLQEKNQRYKDEFRKVQKDRKALKKELEQKKLETAALAKEIDTYMSESSMLKLKLSEALQQLDRTDQDERKDKSAIQKLQKELSAARSDYNAAVSRVARMREEVEVMKVSVARKDEQIKSLTAEVSEQSALVDSLQMELIALKKNHLDKAEYHQLQSENERLNKELGDTLQNASAMVKEREDAIADLLKENDEMKQLVAEQNQEQGSVESKSGDCEDAMKAEIAQLRTELDTAAAALEEAQDRTVLLEEDIEAWIARGSEMEHETERLRDDVEAWQSKAEAAEETIAVVEASARDSAKKVVHLETAMSEAERRHKEQLQEQDRRHKEAMWDLKERTEQRIAEAEKAAKPKCNPQEDALRLAMEKKKAKESANPGNSWGLISQLRGGKSEDSDDLSDDQKKIKTLERTNAEQAADLEKAKSDLVQLLSTHRDTKYTNEKRIEQLVEENKAYAAKQRAMELELASLRQAVSQRTPAPDLVPGSSHSLASF